MPMWSVYRLPVEAYEVTDAPEPHIDPVGRVFRLLFVFIVLQALTFLMVVALWFR